MGLETATYISQLVATNPTASDPVSQGDDHLQLIKSVLQAQFTTLGAAAVTTTAAELNLLDGKTTIVPEGTAVLSTGETGATKFLREDGDNTSSWQVPTDTNTTYTAGDGLDLTGTEFSTDLVSNGGLEIQSAELSVSQGISQYDVAQFAASVVDNDFLRISTTSVEGRSAAEVLTDIAALPLAGGTMTGAVDFNGEQAIKAEIKDYSETVQSLTDNQTVNTALLVAGNVINWSGSGTVTLDTPAIAYNGVSFTLTGQSAMTIAETSTNDIFWAGGTTPTPSGICVFNFFCTLSAAGTYKWFGFDGGQDWAT